MRSIVPLLCFFLVACGESGPPTRGAPVTFEAVCGKANEGKRVMIEGFVEYPSSFKANEDTIMMRVRPTLTSWENVVGASATLGNAANNVEMPPKVFKRSDLKIHTADGQVLGYLNKVKVSGTMYYPSSMAQVEFKCGLTNTLFERGSDQ